MHLLARTVRFSIPLAGEVPEPRPINGHGGWPAPRGMSLHGELTVQCTGLPDARTGYLVNIAHIDRAVRDGALPIIGAAARKEPEREPSTLLRAIAGAIARQLELERHDVALHAVIWHLTPQHRVRLDLSPEEPAMARVRVTQEFSFAAAHRLHVPELSAEQNVAIFGKCNNLNGHGHNYRVDVTVSYAVPEAAPPFTARDLEAVVLAEVIDRFDHKHLNLDTELFRDLVPSVESIAQVCHGLLVRPVATLGGTLEEVTVWETDKTSCTYAG